MIIWYCDGASFSADDTLAAESATQLQSGYGPSNYSTENSALKRRGRRILESTLAMLMQVGMRSANGILLSGDSAGAVGVMQNLDFVRRIFFVGVVSEFCNHLFSRAWFTCKLLLLYHLGCD